jgi:hypothetical protein
MPLKNRQEWEDRGLEVVGWLLEDTGQATLGEEDRVVLHLR